MRKSLTQKTLAIFLMFALVLTIAPVSLTTPVVATEDDNPNSSVKPVASATAEWYRDYQEMDGVGAAYAFTDSLMMLQIAEAGYQDTVQHLLDLTFDDKKGVGHDIVRVIIGDNGSIRPNGSAASPGFNPVTGLLADVNNPGFDIEGNPIPMRGTTGQFGYKPNYNRYYDGNTDSIWPNEPEHEPGTLVPLEGFVWEYESWNKPIPNDEGGATNLVGEYGSPVVIKDGRTRKEIFDADQIWTMKQAMKYGVDTFYACMWTAPYWMSNNYSPNKIIRGDTAVIDGKNVKIYYQAYADYLVYYIKGLWEQWGIPITHICPFNEVDLSGGSADYVMEVINDYVGPTLKKAVEPGGALYGIKDPDGKEIDFVPILCGPDGTNLGASLSRGGKVFSDTDPGNAIDKNPYLDVFTTHLYGTVEIGTDETLLYHRGDFARTPLDYTTNPSKYPEYLTKYKLWQTEFMNQDTGDGSAGAYTNRYGNQNIFDAVRYATLMTNMFCSNPGFSAYIWWSMWDNNGCDGSDLIRFVTNNAQQNPGRTSTLTGQYRIFKRFYGFGHFSRFMEPGDIRFEVTRVPAPDLHVVGFKSADNSDFSITVTNANNDDSIQPIEFTLENFPIGTTSVTVFRTSDSENQKKVGPIPVVDGKFTIDIPSASIVTIVPSEGTYATYEGLDDERDIFSSLEAEGNDNDVTASADGNAGREKEAVVLSDGDYLAYKNINFADGSANGGYVRWHLLYLDALARSEGYGGSLLAYVLPTGTEVNSADDIFEKGARVAEIIIPAKAPYDKYQTMVDTGDLHAHGHKDLYIIAATGGSDDKIIVDRFLFGANDSDWSTAGNNSTVSIPGNILVNGDFDTATSGSTANWSVGRYNNGTFEQSAEDATLSADEIQRYTGLARYLKNSRTSANAASAKVNNRISAEDQYDGLWQDVTGKMTNGERYSFEGYFLSMMDGPLNYEVAAENPGDVKVHLVYYDEDGNQLGMTRIGGREMPEPLAAREAGDPCYWEGNQMYGSIIEGGPLALNSFKAVSVKVANWHESDSDPFIYNEPEGTAKVVLAVYAEDDNIFYSDLLSIVPAPERDRLRDELKAYSGENDNLVNIVKEALVDNNLTQAKVMEMITALENDFYEEMSTALVSIEIDGIEIEGFDPNNLNYSVTYPASGDMPTVTAKAFDSKAEVDIEEADSIPGKSTITVTYDGKQSIYTIEFVADTALSFIKVNDIELETFNPNIYEYTVRVQEGIDVAPIVEVEAISSSADLDITQATEIPGQAIVTVSSGSAESVYTINFIRDINVRDDFDGLEIKEPWNWVNEDPSTWSLSDNPGTLKITTRKGDIYGNSTDMRNILLQDSPGDWTIETKFTASARPSVIYQQGALIAYQDMDNYIKLDWEAQSNRTIIQAAREVNGSVTSNNIGADDIVGDSNTIWLRMSKSGNVYRTYYSVDGETFVELGSGYTLNFSNVKTGLGACNGGGTDTTDFHIYFDYYSRNNSSVGELLPTDKDALIGQITDMSKFTSSGYTAESWSVFEAALNAAIAVRDKSDATQLEVNNASMALENAFRGLVIETKDFEDNTAQGFTGRGNARVSVTDEANHTDGGSYSLKVTGRSASWHGAILDVTKFIRNNSKYRASAWVKLINTGTEDDTTTVKLTSEVRIGGNTNWPNLDEKPISVSDGWIKLEGVYTYKDIQNAAIYIESTSTTASYYIDDIVFECIDGKDIDAPTWPEESSLTVTDAVYSELTLKWTPADDDFGVVNYKILKGIDSQVTVTDGVYSGLEVLTVLPGYIHQYHVTGLMPNSYIFKVEARDEAGNWSNDGPSAAINIEQGEKPWFVKFNDINVTTEEGVYPELPSVVEAVYSDGFTIELEVVWDVIDEADYAKAGTFTVEGTVEGISKNAIATITVYSVKDIETPKWPSGSILEIDETEEGLELSWTKAEDNVGVVGYKIYMNENLIKTTDGDVLSTIIDGLEPGTYNFTVQAGDEAGNWTNDGPSNTITIEEEIIFDRFEEVTIETEVGTAPELPEQIEAIYSDGSRQQKAVTWDSIAPELYEKAGSFTVEGTVEGIAEKAVVTVNVIETTEIKPFIIVPEGELDRNGGIKATVTVVLDPEAALHEGTEAIVFQLMNGDTPVSIIALEKDITTSEKISAFFNVDPSIESYRVEVFVFDKFTSSTSDSPVILAEKVTIE